MKKITVELFLKDIKNNCSEITYLCCLHLFEKLYTDFNEEIEDTTILDNIKNYSLFLRYLNDYAGVIYKKYDSSVEDIYKELCAYFQLNLDNEYRFEHILRKLEKQTPQLLMSLTEDDIQKQTVENFEKKLFSIKNSHYYKENEQKLYSKIEKLEQNIILVKKALQL